MAYNADKKIGELDILTSLAIDDYLPAGDTSDSGRAKAITKANFKTDLGLTGTNSGDQTSIVGITGSLAQFNTALTGADFATGGGTVTGASSGTNTGDNATNTQYSGLAASKQDLLTNSAGLRAALSDENGTGAALFDGATSPTFVTPALGTPSALVLTNATGLPVAGGGTGVATLGDAGVLIGNGTGAVQVTSAGTSGQVLTSNGAGVDPTFQAATGGNLVGTGLSNVTVGNTTTETTLATISIPGGTLGTANAVRITLFLDAMTSISEATVNFRLKYGSTTIATAFFYNNTGGTISECNGVLTAILFANAATNAQKGIIQLGAARLFMVGGQPAMNCLAVGTAAEDSTGALNLVITAQWEGANATNTITMVNYLVEKIR